MTDYKQNSGPWANEVYQAGLTYRADGCFITSLGNLVNLDPPTCAAKLIAGGGLVGGNIVSQAAADALGLEFNGTSDTKPDYDCIAMTDYYEAVYKSEHFFIVKADGTQQDPLGVKTDYPIVNYRLFRNKGDIMTNQGITNFINELSHKCFGDSRPQADKDADVQAILNGDDNTAADIVKGYFQADNNTIMAKSDCKQTVCPDMSLYTLTADIPKLVTPQSAVTPALPTETGQVTPETGQDTTQTSTADYVPTPMTKKTFWQMAEEWFTSRAK